MRLNSGIITDKHTETKKFYTEVLDFGITFTNDFYLLLHTPNKKDELAFLMPKHPSQHSILHPKFGGKGMFLTIEVEDVDILYDSIKAKGISLALDIKDEPWGDRHFALLDPNGIVIDIVTYQKPE
ncbi:MAG: VOC family protein [Ghiorsea sp.]|nr:VOC family protein [Ghiorsea sp.]